MNKEQFKQELLKRANSKNVLENYSISDDTRTLSPSMDLHKAVRTIEKDPVVRGAIKWKTDRVMEGGWRVIHTEDNKPDTAFEQRLQRDLLFEKDFLVPIVHNLCWINNAFGEIVRGAGTGKVVGLNGLDATSIEPITDSNGDVIKYESAIEEPDTGRVPTWKPVQNYAGEQPDVEKTDDKLVWFQVDDRQRGYAPIEVESIYQTVQAKAYARKFIAWLFRSGQYRNVHVLDEMTEGTRDDFLTMFEKTANWDYPMVMEGNYDNFPMRDLEELTGFKEVMEMLNQELLVSLRVPPTAAGIPEGSGRSTADTMTDVGLTNVRNIRRAIKFGINHELFPEMNKGENRFIWNPTDMHEERRILERLNVMHNMGMTKEAKREYMKDKGMVFDSGDVFKEEPKNRDINMMDSRFSSEDSPDENIGTGDESSTREEQLDDAETGDTNDS